MQLHTFQILTLGEPLRPRKKELSADGEGFGYSWETNGQFRVLLSSPLIAICVCDAGAFAPASSAEGAPSCRKRSYPFLGML